MYCVYNAYVYYLLYEHMCELCVFPNPLLDMCLLMNLSFINILSKFNSNTFCLRCCCDDDDIDIQSPPPSLFTSSFALNSNFHLFFPNVENRARVLAYSFALSLIHAHAFCVRMCRCEYECDCECV